MRVFATLYRHHKAYARAKASSDLQDASLALMACLEQIYKELDVAEPVWVSKHARELSQFRHTAFFPDDFLEPVQFDKLEIELEH